MGRAPANSAAMIIKEGYAVRASMIAKKAWATLSMSLETSHILLLQLASEHPV